MPPRWPPPDNPGTALSRIHRTSRRREPVSLRGEVRALACQDGAYESQCVNIKDVTDTAATANKT